MARWSEPADRAEGDAVLIIRTLRGVPVTCCVHRDEARVLMAGMEHHYITRNVGADVGPQPYTTGLAGRHPVDVYAQRALDEDVARLKAAWLAGCNA